MRYIKAIAFAILSLLPVESWGGCAVFIDPVSFGEYDSINPATLYSTGTVNVTCDSGLPYQISLDQGANSGGSYATRKMKKVGDTATMNYNLYNDAACAQTWGDGTGSTFIVSGTGSGTSIQHIVYGKIPGGQIMLPAGAYGDTVVVTVVW